MKRLSWLLAACLGVALFVTSGSKAAAQAPIYVQPVPAPVPVAVVAPVAPVEVVGYPNKKAWKYATGRAPARAYYGPRRYYRGGPRVVVVW